MCCVGVNFVLELSLKKGNGSYYKNKLELKSNSSEILPVTCKFIWNSVLT